MKKYNKGIGHQKARGWLESVALGVWRSMRIKNLG